MTSTPARMSRTSRNEAVTRSTNSRNPTGSPGIHSATPAKPVPAREHGTPVERRLDQRGPLRNRPGYAPHPTTADMPGPHLRAQLEHRSDGATGTADQAASGRRLQCVSLKGQQPSMRRNYLKALLAVAAASALVAGATPASASAAYSSNGSFSADGTQFLWTLNAGWEIDNVGEFGAPGDTLPIEQVDSTVLPSTGVASGASGTFGAVTVTNETGYQKSTQGVTGDMLALYNVDDDVPYAGMLEMYTTTLRHVAPQNTTGGAGYMSQWVRWTGNADGSINLPPAFSAESTPLYGTITGAVQEFSFAASDSDGPVSYSLVTNNFAPFNGADTLACSSFSAEGLLRIDPSLCSDGVFASTYTTGTYWAVMVEASDASGNTSIANLTLRADAPTPTVSGEYTGTSPGGYSFLLGSGIEDGAQPYAWELVCTNTDNPADVVSGSSSDSVAPSSAALPSTYVLDLEFDAPGQAYDCVPSATNIMGGGPGTSFLFTVPTEDTTPVVDTPTTPDVTTPVTTPVVTEAAPAPTQTATPPSVTCEQTQTCLAPVAPETPVAPGNSVALVNGVPVPVTLVPNEDNSGLVASGDGWKLNLAGANAGQKPAELNPEGRLVLQPGLFASTAGEGFQPNTDVKVYLFSEPTLLGTLTTDANGKFTGNLPIPTSIAAGNHTLQVNGFGTNAEVRSISLGVVLQVPEVKTATTVVYFAPGSPKIDAKAKAKIKSLVRSVSANGTVTSVEVRVTGYVQPTNRTANDTTLSTARARAVAKLLKANGLVGKYAVTGAGQAKETGASARRVKVTVKYIPS